MKNFKILVIAAFLILTATISTGCTGSGQTTPAENTPQATQITVETTAVPAETIGSQIDGELKPGDKVNAAEVAGNDFSWYEYRINRSSEMPPNGIVSSISTQKTERSISEYNGTPAIHYKHTFTAKGYEAIADEYYDTSMTNHLGGKYVSTMEGKTPEIKSLPPEEVNRDQNGFFKRDTLLIYQGIESVTVPMGTYPDARKYIWYNTENQNEYSYWFAQDVPVPILYQFPNSGIVGYNGFESHELIAWG